MIKKLILVLSATFCTIGTVQNAHAIVASTTDLCGDIAGARNESVSKRQEQIEREHEVMQNTRDDLEDCMIDVSGTLGSVVGKGGAFGTILDLYGKQMDKAACKAVVDKTREAVRKLEDAAVEAVRETGIQDIYNNQTVQNIGSGAQAAVNAAGAASNRLPPAQQASMFQSSPAPTATAPLTQPAAVDSKSAWDSLGKLLGN